MSHGQGGTARTWSSRSGPGRGTWVSWAELRVAEEVSGVRVDHRLLPVARHGNAIVVWTRRPSGVAALDGSGAVLEWIPFGRFG